MLACRARATEAVGVVAAAAPTSEVKAMLPDLMAAAFQVGSRGGCRAGLCMGSRPDTRGLQAVSLNILYMLEPGG